MASLRDLTLYRVDVRIPKAELHRILIARVKPAPIALLPELSVDWNPPAVGPEVQLSFTVGALSATAAEKRGGALLVSRGLTVLAIRGREPNPLYLRNASSGVV